jgi:hypothetical protein
MQCKEQFEPDRGFRLFKNNCSILLRASSFGSLLDERQKTAFYSASLNYLEGIEKRPLSEVVSPRSLSPSDFPDLAAPSFCKFVSGQVADYLRLGRFRFGTPQYYREIEDEGRADHLEGFACLFVKGKEFSVNLMATAAFNTVILCGIEGSHLNEDELSRMRGKFGEVLVEIADVNAFCQKVLKKIRGIRYKIKDIQYADGKFTSVKQEAIDGFYANFRAGLSSPYGSLTDEALRILNRTYWQRFYKHLLMPAAFSKPTRFASEKERRLLFELPADVKNQYIDIEIPEAVKYLRFT